MKNKVQFRPGIACSNDNFFPKKKNKKKSTYVEGEIFRKSSSSYPTLSRKKLNTGVRKKEIKAPVRSQGRSNFFK